MANAAAGIVAALGSCKCDEALEFLWDALEVMSQLGSSPEEERQLLHLWAVAFGSVGHTTGVHYTIQLPMFF